MKKLACIFLLIACAGAFAEDKTITFVDKVTGGELSFDHSKTNANVAYELKHVSFSIPTSGITNTFTLRKVVTYKLPATQVDVVTTNSQITSGYYGQVETNTVYYDASSVTFTNDMVLATTTNDSSVQYFDADDFYMGNMVEFGMEQRFIFSETNAINLIRVYNVYSRP